VGRPRYEPKGITEVAKAARAQFDESEPLLSHVGPKDTPSLPAYLAQAPDAKFNQAAFLQMIPDENQRLLAQRASTWVIGYLRWTSGAAISNSEFANAYNAFIPGPNDTQKILDAKRSSRLALHRELAAGIYGPNTPAFRNWANNHAAQNGIDVFYTTNSNPSAQQRTQPQSQNGGGGQRFRINDAGQYEEVR
jgi:hypothetical protein